MKTEVQIPGLNRSLTIADLEQSRQLYNSLPSDDAQPSVENLLQRLAKIFIHNHAQEVFGVHLIHGHFRLPEKHVLVGDYTVPRCRWTKPCKTISLNLDRLRGHTFILTDDGFHPYEYHSSEYPDMTQIGDKFFSELANFLRMEGLSKVIALELLDNPLPGPMMELVLGDQGTMMLETSRLRDCKVFRQTGWAFHDRGGKPRVCQDGQQYHAAGPTGHIVLVTPRDETEIETSSDALETLRNHGLVVS